MTVPLYSHIEEKYPLPPFPKKIIKYRSYKDGVCKVFDTWADANLYSKLIEKFNSNEDEYKEQLNIFMEAQSKIYDEWKKELYSFFSQYPTTVIDLLYNSASNDVDNCDYDSMAERMAEYSNFIKEYENCLK